MLGMRGMLEMKVQKMKSKKRIGFSVSLGFSSDLDGKHLLSFRA
jgi:hypothetical protein